MIHIKWVILAVIIVAWLWVCHDDLNDSGYGTGLVTIGATLLAVIFCLVCYIIFF